MNFSDPASSRSTDERSVLVSAPAHGEPALPPYEPPSLTPAGNLFNVLGKSGPSTDFTYRRPNTGRP